MSWKKAIKLIKENNSFLIAAHKSPEGDSLGSQLAFYALLRNLKKKVSLYNADIVPANYRFLPFSHLIKNTPPQGNFDVGVVLDCSGPFRLGKIENAFFKKCRTIINIDHHISNSYFGDVNIVYPDASSASELVFRLYEKMKEEISPAAALCLYCGIFTDTGSFSYNSTSFQVHRIASFLLKKGVKPAVVYENVYSSLTRRDMAYISEIISTLKTASQGKLCWIKAEKWQKSGFDVTEIVFYILRFLKTAEVLLFFKKLKPNTIRVNFRSRGRIDVNKIAQAFGGGGHKTAAGLTLNTSLPQAEKLVVGYIKNKLGT